MNPENEVLTAFDEIAPVFDEKLENAVTRRLRKRLYGVVEELAPRGARVLDLNCGTGTDMVFLLQRGYRVTGNDLSPAMIAEARRKTSDFPGVEFSNVSFEHLDRAGLGTFDVVLSNFGGLNCVKDLRPAAEQLAKVVRPRGIFVAVVMPPFCLWETAAGLFRANLAFAFRRWKAVSAATGFNGKTFPVFYHSLSSFRRAFRFAFEFRYAFALSLLSPPPHAVRLAENHPTLLRLLEGAERLVEGVPFLRSWGDHYVAIVQRNEK